MSRENGDFTPVEATKVEQLENLLLREQEVREHRAMTGGLDTLVRFDNPDFQAPDYEQPVQHTIVFDKALLRGLRRIKKTLHDDIVYDDNGYVQPGKKTIVNGLIEAYSGNDR